MQTGELSLVLARASRSRSAASMGRLIRRRWPPACQGQDGSTTERRRISAPRFEVASEAGVLNQAIVHRPGGEIAQVTPEDRSYFLFDDLPWPRGAAAEHDTFVGVLHRYGVAVHDVTDLLTDVLDGSHAAAFIGDYLRNTQLPALTQAALCEWLIAQASDVAATVLVTGLTPDSGKDGKICRDYESRRFILPPLPNLMFTRDSSFLVGACPVVARMRAASRSPEAHLLDCLYRWHSLFAAEDPLDWAGGCHVEESLEGGDVMVPDSDRILIGLSERTTAGAAEGLTEQLLAVDRDRQVYAVELPRSRATMHLDTLITFVDADAAVVSPCALELPTRQLVARAGSITDGDPEPFGAVVSKILARHGRPRLLSPPVDHIEIRREWWDDAHNVLALRPGTVIDYESNERTNAFLSHAGIEVIPIRGAELRRTRGGPRCLTCPIRRQPIG
jgi:arginine deiminase